MFRCDLEGKEEGKAREIGVITNDFFPNKSLISGGVSIRIGCLTAASGLQGKKKNCGFQFVWVET